MSITVTASQSGSGLPDGIILTVKVLTGQALSPIGTVASTTTAESKAIVPAASGSKIYGAVSGNLIGTQAANGSSTLSGSKADGGTSWAGATLVSKAATTAGASVTLGVSQSSSTCSVALVEIKSGGSLAEDASSPASVSTTAATTETTAAFTPPGGSLLVAMVGSEVAFGNTSTLTVSDSSGLTWTKQEQVGDDAVNYLASVWTAVVPGGSVGPTLGVPALAFAAHPLVPSVLTGTVALGKPSLTFTAHPLSVSAGIKTQGLGVSTLTFTPHPLVPVVLKAFPNDPLVVKVELLMGANWVDVSEFVYFSEASDSISITGGRPDESGFVNPSTLALTVNNNDGRFSPKNANSPYYGLIGRNTQIRVSVQASNPHDGTFQFRAWQEVAEWPFVWSPNDVDRRGQLKASGVLRRLQASGSIGTSPANLPLPLAATIAGMAGTSLAPIAWWPCTEPDGSTQFASGIPLGTPMAFTGKPGLAADSSFPGSAALATFGGTTWTGLLPGGVVGPGSTSTITDTFTRGTDWVAPQGVTVIQSVKATGWGGNGAAGVGGGSPASGGGGGGGGVSSATNVTVTPGHVYAIEVQAGLDSIFPGDSATVTGGVGGNASGTTGGDGGSGDLPGGKGGEGFSDPNSGGGGGGAGGGDGQDGGQFAGSGAGGSSGNGGRGGSGGFLNGNGGSGQSPGGGGAGGGPGSSDSGGFGAPGSVVIKYQVAGGGNIDASGGPQNANVLRFLLDMPAEGDVDGAEIALMATSGDAIFAQVLYHAGIAILSAGLGTSAITSIAVEPVPEPITSGSVITVLAQDGTSQEFTTSSGVSTGAISIPVHSATPAITTEAGDTVTKGADKPGYLQMFLLSEADTLVDTGLVAFETHGKPMMVSVELVQDGADIDWAFLSLPVGASEFSGPSGTITSAGVGSAGVIIMNRLANLNGTAAGQVTLQYAASDLAGLADPLDGYVGETAGNRFLRLCAQQGVNAQVVGDAGVSVMMGAQASDTFVNLIQGCETADMGLVFEPRTFFGLAYRTRASMLSQSPGANLDYAAFTLPDDPALAPDYDDAYTSNDITVSRTGGSSREVTLAEGRMSVQPPPLGVGQYASSVEVNLANDGQLRDICGWLLHRSTVDEYRFPTVAVRMEYPEVGQTDLFGAVSGIDIGDFVQISNPPDWLVSDSVKQVVYGNSETIKPFSWVLNWNSVPESPYEVALADSTIYRADTSGSTLVADVSSTDTTLSVATTRAGSALWTVNPDHFPFDIALNGERMTVTDITGTSSPQAFTVTRSVNGVIKSHAADEAVTLFSPPIATI